MPHPQKVPLRPLTPAERRALEAVARAGSERADRVARAKALLAVADGASFTAAARAAGRRPAWRWRRLVARFNAEGLAALTPGHGGGPPTRYGAAERERILREVRRAPDRERDGTATWSLTTLQRALRRAPDGLPAVSTWTILARPVGGGVHLAGEPDLVRHGGGPAPAPRRHGGRQDRPDATPKKG